MFENILFAISGMAEVGGEAPDLPESLDFATGIFAAVLFVMSLFAYRRTNMKRLLFVSAAFGLYAFRAILPSLEIILPTSRGNNHYCNTVINRICNPCIILCSNSEKELKIGKAFCSYSGNLLPILCEISLTKLRIQILWEKKNPSVHLYTVFEPYRTSIFYMWI
ncbi:hypothetical protein DYY67_0522 [Candidatus Nitrosotalea sp. TS]|uniref:hypothetical protein n=1 Tax=Candidatus Nitrosotalea sp. TS TaxID=2341020 RepID=UPI00140E0E6A|nr:hypothetical protein [Candidatus Nitrosotalea sp. TS]NHI02483.1 hypothetical protein [Candidatus Nitrosotalea sp. TS]